MFIVVYSSSSLFKSFRSLSFKVSVLVFQCATPATPATPQNALRGTSGPSMLGRTHLPGTSKRHGGSGEKPRIDFEATNPSFLFANLFVLFQSGAIVASWKTASIVKMNFHINFMLAWKLLKVWPSKVNLFGLWHSGLTQAGEDDTLVHARPRRSAFLCTSAGIEKCIFICWKEMELLRWNVLREIQPVSWGHGHFPVLQSHSILCHVGQRPICWPKKIESCRAGPRFARVHQTPGFMGPFESKTGSLFWPENYTWHVCSTWSLKNLPKHQTLDLYTHCIHSTSHRRPLLTLQSELCDASALWWYLDCVSDLQSN